METSQEISTWASVNHLTDATVKLLLENGFTSLALLRHLSTDNVTDDFQKPRLLNLAQCLALKTAVKTLQGKERGMESVHHPPASPTRQAMEGLGPNHSSVVNEPGPRYRNEIWQPVALPTLQAIGPNDIPEDDNAKLVLPGWSPTNHNSSRSKHSHGLGDEFRFLLLGKTGSGKSTTGNTILGAHLFSTAVSFASVTAKCELKRNNHLGKDIQIMDSPGLFDTTRSHDDIAVDIVKAVACMHPGPHAILYVLPLGRYTEEEYAVYKRLKALFDEHLTRYLIVLFTGGDRLGPSDTMENLLKKVPKGLSKVLQECEHRSILFNNKTSNKQPQVEKLFDLVTDMIAKNKNQPYTCPKYEAVGRSLEQEVARRLQEVEESDLQKTRYVQKLQEESKAAQEAMLKERASFEQREKEREEKMRREDEDREEKMQEMITKMKEQELSLKKQKEEEQKIREEMEADKQRQWEEMEKRRQSDKEEMERREKQLQKLLQQEVEASKQRELEREKERKQMLQDVQDSVASSDSGGGGFRDFFGNLVPFIVKGITKLFTKF